MSPEQITELARQAAEALWALEKGHPTIDWSPLHKACEALFDAMALANPGVVKPDGGGPK